MDKVGHLHDTSNGVEKYDGYSFLSFGHLLEGSFWIGFRGSIFSLFWNA